MSNPNVFMIPDNEAGGHGGNSGIDPNLLLALNQNGGFGANGNWMWLLFLWLLFPAFGGGWGNGFGGFGGFGGGGQRRKPVYKGQDLRMRIELELNDIVHGVTKKFNLRTDIQCPHCKGTGSEDGQEATCSNCNGQGTVYKTRQTMLGIIKTQTVSETCQGEGTVI